MKKMMFGLLAVCMMVGLVNADAIVLYETGFTVAEGYTAGESITSPANAYKGWSATGGNVVIDGVFIITPPAGTYVAAAHAFDASGYNSIIAETTMQFSGANADAGGVFQVGNEAGGGAYVPRIAMNAASGLYYSQNGGANGTLISSDDILADTKYAITLTIDTVNHTYDITATPDGGSAVSATGIAFKDTTAFTSLELGGYQTTPGAQTASAYFDVTISGVPEPTTALLLCGGAAFAFAKRRK